MNTENLVTWKRIDAALDRIVVKIEVDRSTTDGCWIWNGATDRNGYGRFGLTPYLWTQAHHLTWIHVNLQPVPVGLELDHLCNNRLCVNPDHLEPVTHLENMQRAAARRRLKKVAA